MSLTPREKRFVAEYAIDLNARAAARRAGYSETYARAAKLMQRPDIRGAVAEHQAPLLERAGITAERVLREVVRIAFADPRKLVHPDGRPRAVQELDDDTAAAVASIQFYEKPNGHRLLRIRLNDKISALVLLARHLGLFHDRLEVTLGDGMAGNSMAEDYEAAQEHLL